MRYKVYCTTGGKLLLSGGKLLTHSLPEPNLISGGDYYSSSIDKNGNLWTWGYNNYGQLGDNSTINKSIPISIMGINKTFCKISLSNSHSISIDNNGQVWGWGYNTSGQLGINSKTQKLTPVSILGLKKTFCEIADGNSASSFAIDKNGQVWGWGYNNKGQLGDNSIVNKSTPVSILGVKKTFCEVSSGDKNVFAIDNYGQIWGWGYNNYGQLGDNTSVSKSTPISILGVKKTFCQISAAYTFFTSIDKYGQIWTWGYNGQGQLGINSSVNKSTPVSILGVKKTFCLISAYYDHSMAIDKYGQIWSWGNNVYGQLGNYSRTQKNTPVSILGIKKTFCQISCGIWHSLSIDQYNQIWAWGYNYRGQLGNNNTLNKFTPVSILGNKKTFCNINAGTNYNTVIDKNGQVWTWGFSYAGNLGDNTTIFRSTPVSILGVKKTFCQITATNQVWTSNGIDYNGQIWGWGYNSQGQIGNNTITSTCTPVSILGVKKTFCQISAGHTHILSIDKSGLIWSWGANTYGGLGDNSVTSRRTPVSILGVKKTFCQISGGANHSISIDKNGQIWTWGYNNAGQLADNSVVSKRTPVSILGNKKTFCLIVGSASASYAIEKNGQLWSWGGNSLAQLGDNTTTNKSTPISILGVKKTFCQIGSGANYAAAIDKNGQIWTWGTNSNGVLGINNDLTSKKTPVSILGITKTFCQINCEDSHIITIDKYGQSWCWGSNLYAQLGINVDVITTPIKVCL